MNKDSLVYYKVIGKLHSVATKATSLTEAFRDGVRIMHAEFAPDAMIIWYADTDEVTFRPYYWIGPLDFTSKVHMATDDQLNKVFKTQSSYRGLNYLADPVDCITEDFEGIDIGSVICVPFSSERSNYGCIEMVKFAGNGFFTDEMADTCEIMAQMFAMGIEDNEDIDFVPYKYKFDKLLLSARDVEKSFKSGEGISHILNGVNLDVYEGEFLAVLGPSGCGKSTFLNIIGGMDVADKGSIKFEGNEMFGLTTRELTDYRRYNIGFVFQSYNLMPNLTAIQNLDLIAELVDDAMDSKEALEMVGLSDKMDRYPAQLSGGQQQRISIARALVKKPKIIFADEPTAALDYKTSIEVLGVFEKIVEAGTTLVMVTHNEEITKMANRVLRFRNGRTHEITINKNPVCATELVW